MIGRNTRRKTSWVPCSPPDVKTARVVMFEHRVHTTLIAGADYVGLIPPLNLLGAILPCPRVT